MRWEELELLETERRQVFLQHKRYGYHRDFGKFMRFAKREENTCVGNNQAYQKKSVRNLWHQMDTVLLVAVKLACYDNS